MLAAWAKQKEKEPRQRSAMPQGHCAAIGSGVRRKNFVLPSPLISLCPTSSCLRVHVPSSGSGIRGWLLCHHCLFLLRFQASLHYCPAAPGIMLIFPSLLCSIGSHELQPQPDSTYHRVRQHHFHHLCRPMTKDVGDVDFG